MIFFSSLKNKGFDYHQVRHVQYKFQVYKIYTSKVIVDDKKLKKVTLIMIENRTSVSCNDPKKHSRLYEVFCT